MGCRRDDFGGAAGVAQKAADFAPCSIRHDGPRCQAMTDRGLRQLLTEPYSLDALADVDLQRIIKVAVSH
jgi:hypothetical protein